MGAMTPSSATASLVVEAMSPADWPAVRDIYAEGIATGQATFETSVPRWEEWDVAHLPSPRLVARRGSAIAGWAALSPVSDRCAYAGVAEDSVYVGAGFRGQGVGRALLTRLLETSDGAGLWTIQCGIFPENTASLALHHSCGFRVVGTRERIGVLQGRWRDVLLLERRKP
jgi:L-amino acid N-acyltransferase YncA